MNPTISPSQLALYGLPALVVGYMFLLVNVYVLKYATDVLLIAPAVMGAIFGLGRIWDAFTDPVVGYLSDRTRSKLGRRRIWLAWSIVPATVFYIMVYASPIGMGPTGAAVWMAISIFGFYTAMTAITVPHLSLGAEITKDSYTRNRLFGMRHGMIGVGAILALLTLAWFNSIDPASQQLRNASMLAAVVASALSVACVLATVFFFKEPALPVALVQQQEGVYAASRDILGNRHARLLLLVQFIESIGAGALSAASLYVAQYVMNNIAIAPVVIIAYLATSTASIPGWVALSKRVPKVSLWVATMVGSALSYGGLFSLVFIENSTTQTGLLILLCTISGAMSGCAQTLAPSVLSDIIDHDDLQTGTRKEGAYFALYNLATKSAHGVTIMIAGFVLSAAGFVPNTEQTFAVQLAMCGILGLLPFVCYAIGAVLFTRFDLNAEKHREVVTALEERNARAASR